MLPLLNDSRSSVFWRAYLLLSPVCGHFISQFFVKFCFLKTESITFTDILVWPFMFNKLKEILPQGVSAEAVETLALSEHSVNVPLQVCRPTTLWIWPALCWFSPNAKYEIKRCNNLWHGDVELLLTSKQIKFMKQKEYRQWYKNDSVLFLYLFQGFNRRFLFFIDGCELFINSHGLFNFKKKRVIKVWHCYTGFLLAFTYKGQ